MGRLPLIRLLHIIHRCNDTQMAVIQREKLGRKRAGLVGKFPPSTGLPSRRGRQVIGGWWLDGFALIHRWGRVGACFGSPHLRGSRDRRKIRQNPSKIQHFEVFARREHCSGGVELPGGYDGRRCRMSRRDPCGAIWRQHHHNDGI